MKNFITIVILITLSSCAVTYKKDNPDKLANEKALAIKKAEEERQKILNDAKNWQHQYYEQAIFKVQNPIIVQTEKELEAICGGSEFKFKNSYQLKSLSYVKFKKYPIAIKTKSGFSKKVFVTKGVCREIALTVKKQSKSMRKKIKMINLLYVYNVGTYVLDITFATKFKGVDFFVK